MRFDSGLRRCGTTSILFYGSIEGADSYAWQPVIVVQAAEDSMGGDPRTGGK